MNKTEQRQYVRQKHEYKLQGKDNYFYMYIHVREDTLEPFYVGKGCGSRAWNHNNRNEYWTNTANKHGVITEIVFDSLTENEALQCEVDSIIEYLYIGYKICNLSSGGDTPTFNSDVRNKMSNARLGLKRTPEAIAKIAAAHTGMKRSPETCKRISESLKGKPRTNREAVLRGALKISGGNSIRADQNIYRFIQKCGNVFVGCRHELIEKYPYMRRLLSKLFGSNPRDYSKDWTLVEEGQFDHVALLKFSKPKTVPIRTFINKNGDSFTGTYSDFCSEYGLSKSNYLKLFNTKLGAVNTYNGWSLLKETDGTNRTT